MRKILFLVCAIIGFSNFALANETTDTNDDGAVSFMLADEDEATFRLIAEDEGNNDNGTMFVKIADTTSDTDATATKSTDTSNSNGNDNSNSNQDDNSDDDED